MTDTVSAGISVTTQMAKALITTRMMKRIGQLWHGRAWKRLDAAECAPGHGQNSSDIDAGTRQTRDFRPDERGSEEFRPRRSCHARTLVDSEP
ncbi:hypothetical protein GCM10022240_04800 [Microbacterium kribbense]|uniref:Uncharacterized protein n=1 Tax=Microbacterium kribbense TaxID=433645 RepID=A0ABP7G567_9MICO